MHRRTNRKNPPFDTSEMIDSVVGVYNNMYGDVSKDMHSSRLPNILNFDLGHGQTRGQSSGTKNFSLFENEPSVSTPVSKSIPIDFDNNKKQEIKTSIKQNPIGTKSNEKYGVKTLINTKSKMTYPFDKPIDQPSEQAIRTDGSVKDTVKIAASDVVTKCSNNQLFNNKGTYSGFCDDIEQYIAKEALAIKETFIESDKVLHPETKVKIDQNEKLIGYGSDKCATTVDTNENNEPTVVLRTEPVPSPVIVQTVTVTPTTLSGDQSVSIPENFSDIEIRMGRSGNTKKIDNKNDENNIVNIENKQESLTNMETATKEIVVTLSPGEQVENKTPVTEPLVAETAEKVLAEEKSETKLDEFKWPDLTIENIITTFKVVGDLREGSKLKVENDRFLTIDASYIQSISRWRSDQGREKIISFLGHLLKETKRTITNLVKEVRNNIDVDANISVVEKLISRMSIFLHTYDIMKIAYKGDAGAYARLGAIRDEFYDFRGNLFRDILVPK